MTDALELQFNGEQFRVIAIDEHGERKTVGNPSADLQLALWSASSALGRRWLTIPLRVAGP